MKAKILVIDDDYASGHTMKWAMEDAGHQVAIATNGVTAISKINEFIPDIVLCDITMPKLDGYETCERLRRDARLQNTLFIAQTGLSSPSSKRRSAKAGFAYHLVKPVDIDELLRLVALKAKTPQAPTLVMPSA